MTESALRDLLNKFRTDVATFNEQVVGVPIPSQPTELTPERARFRGAFLQEELNEFMLAHGKGNMDDQVDALIDMTYVAIGTLLEMGVLVQPTWDEVQRANMAKRRGETKRTGSGGYDAVKPEGWVAPSHADYLAITSEDVRLLQFMKNNQSGVVTFDGNTVWKAGEKPEQLTLEFETLRLMEGESSAPKLLILGHGRHGKDTVCELLEKHYGLRFTSSSFFCAEQVILPAVDKAWRDYAVTGNGSEDLPPGPYGSAETCYEDRHNHRAFWYETIRDFNRPDATALGRAIYAENDVYCGLRSKAEFHALRNAGVFDYAIWVDASDRMPPEDASSCTVEPWMADFVLDNNGTVEDLEFNLKQLMEGIL